MDYLENIKSPQELLEFMDKNLKYGFVADGKVFTFPRTDDAFQKKYKIRLGDDLIKAGCNAGHGVGYGVCWDFVEFERRVFENLGIEHECYYVQSPYKENPERTATHTFLIYKEGDDKRWKLFKPLHGIYEFETKAQAIKSEVTIHLQAKNCLKDKFDLFKYPKVTENFTIQEFVNHCRAGEEMQTQSFKLNTKDNG